MLTLRTAVCNERWQETWDHITRQQRRQRLVQRKQRAQARWQQRLSRLMLVLLRWRLAVKKPTPACRRPVAPAATLPGSSRPSAHHPWKRTPACRPKPRAKT